MSNARLSILQARAVKDRRISDAQFRTLAALGMYADEDGWCFPMLATLGKDLSKSKQAVGRDTIALRKLGYLEVKARFDDKGGRRSSMYRLKFDLPPVNMGDSTPSTSEVDTPSTSEVDVNDPNNAPINDKDTPTELEAEQMKFDLIELQFNSNIRPYFAEFYRLTGILPEGKKQVKDWKDKCALLFGAKLLVSDMEQAFKLQMEKNYTTKDPGSLMTNMQMIKLRREKGVPDKPDKQEKPNVPKGIAVAQSWMAKKLSQERSNG